MARIVLRPGGRDRLRRGPLAMPRPRLGAWPPLGRGLTCNICGSRTPDRHAAERHRERVHPEAAGPVHARG